MQPYGRDVKLRYNYEDLHPPKGYINWWEDIITPNKKRARRNSKKEIKSQLIDYYT